MELQELLELSGVILGTLGSGAAIIFGFSTWLGKVWANRLMEHEKSKYSKDLEELKNKLSQDAETYKIKLKKSEFIFQKEYEAVSEYVALLIRVSPSYSFPGMEWGDACDEIARNSSSIERMLSEFMSKHGAVLNDETISLISSCIHRMAEMKFKISDDIPTPESSMAGEIFKDLQKAESLLKEKFHAQSCT